MWRNCLEFSVKSGFSQSAAGGAVPIRERYPPLHVGGEHLSEQGFEKVLYYSQDCGRLACMERAHWRGNLEQDQAQIQQGEKQQPIGNSIIRQVAGPSASEHAEAEAEKLANLDKAAAPFFKAVERVKVHVGERYPQWRLNVQRSFGSDGWVNEFYVSLVHKEESRLGNPDVGGRVTVPGPMRRRYWALTENYRTLTEDEHYAKLMASLSDIWHLIERAERMQHESP